MYHRHAVSVQMFVIVYSPCKRVGCAGSKSSSYKCFCCEFHDLHEASLSHSFFKLFRRDITLYESLQELPSQTEPPNKQVSNPAATTPKIWYTAKEKLLMGLQLE